MFKKIDKPKIEFNFNPILDDDQFYFDGNNYFLFNDNVCNNINHTTQTYCLHFNKDGYCHRLDGYALLKRNKDNIFYIEGNLESYYSFAKKTKHLQCSSCKDFCKQECFI